MANEEHLKILRQGVEAWNRWSEENRDIQPGLRRADLRKADLMCAKLGGADLREANLEGAKLGGADLHNANLRGADLIGADLGEAILARADLRDAYLREAILRKADLSGADLSGAYLIGANLSGANLSAANLSRANLSGANVEGAIVGWSVFGDVDLSAVKGLDTVRHRGSSTVGIDTIYESKGKVPEVFLRNCGVPDQMIAFIVSLPGQPDTNRAKLRMMIDKYFDKSELQTLCFDMGVDYDGLGGENKSDKARELVAYFQRRGTIRDLVAKCKELRPNVSWEGEYE
jgi:hypothetical protein